MKIAVVVHGRFHAFEFIRSLRRRGHEAVVFTNYPVWAARRLGIDPAWVRSFWFHGVISRLCAAFTGRMGIRYPESFFHPWFGRWAKKNLERERWDVVHAWSGVAEESLRNRAKIGGIHVLMRGSAHIRTQRRILEEERQRTGARIDCPGDWIIKREEKEYGLADRIAVLSSFARDSFLEQGIPAEKLWLLPLGVDPEVFRLPEEAIQARTRRILSGEPLRVLYVGAISFQKGFLDLTTLARSLQGEPFRFRALGPVSKEVLGLLHRSSDFLETVAKQPQRELPLQYRWADLFVFPTLQDGYAMVLAQAQAGGLPILTTTHCGGPDMIREGETGWLVPIRSPAAMAERLRWCQLHRRELAEMATAIAQQGPLRSWEEVAEDFETLCRKALAEGPFTGPDAAEGKS